MEVSTIFILQLDSRQSNRFSFSMQGAISCRKYWKLWAKAKPRRGWADVTNSLIASLPLHKVTLLLRSSVNTHTKRKERLDWCCWRCRGWVSGSIDCCICQFSMNQTDSLDSTIIEIFTAIETFKHIIYAKLVRSPMHSSCYWTHRPKEPTNQWTIEQVPQSSWTCVRRKLRAAWKKHCLSDVTVKRGPKECLLLLCLMKILILNKYAIRERNKQNMLCCPVRLMLMSSSFN